MTLDQRQQSRGPGQITRTKIDYYKHTEKSAAKKCQVSGNCFSENKYENFVLIKSLSYFSVYHY